MRHVSELEVEGKRLQVSNLEKVLYPKTGFTKAQLIEYYIKISGALLPHLKGRPLTLKRYPNGVHEDFFYEKQCPSHRPEWIQTAPVQSERREKLIHYCLANDLPTLVWMANLADIELHTSLARHPRVDEPTMVVFDLDPGAPADVLLCAQVALWLREYLGDFQSFPKTSGSKGLQVYCPLNTASDFETTKAFAHAVAEHLESEHPRLITSRMAKNLRTGRVFIDWSQNDRHKTTVSVYSLRATDEPTVSTPVTWDEVEDALDRKDPARLRFTWDQVIQRARDGGDLFAPVLSLKQRLPQLREKMPA